jgi:hypothetical protein
LSDHALSEDTRRSLTRKTGDGFPVAVGLVDARPGYGWRHNVTARSHWWHRHRRRHSRFHRHAAAADLPLAKAPVPVAPVAHAQAAIYSWTAFHIGGRSSWSDPFTGANSAFNGGPGFLGCGQVGANYHLDMLVLGVEGDFTWTGSRGGGTDSIGDTINTNTNLTSTVTGRVGAAFDRLLIYGKGVVAFSRDQSGFTDLAGNNTSNALPTTGWTGGSNTASPKTGRSRSNTTIFGSQPLNFTTPTTPLYTSNSSLNV